MLSERYLRSEAAQCRVLATKAYDRNTAERWIALAASFERLANRRMPRQKMTCVQVSGRGVAAQRLRTHASHGRSTRQGHI